MKKVSKIVVVVASLVLAVGLSACGKGQSNQTQSSTSATSQVKKADKAKKSTKTKTSRTSTSSTTSKTSESSTQAVEQTTTSSQSAPKVDDQTIFAQTLNEYRGKSDASVYAFVDLDGDGQNELLMGDQSNRGGYYISGVYMLFKKKQIAPLGISYVASGDGVRKAVLVYQGGYMYSEEGASYDPMFHGRLIKIVGDHYIIVKEEDFSLENEKAEEKFGLNQYAPLNTDTIQWQAL